LAAGALACAGIVLWVALSGQGTTRSASTGPAGCTLGRLRQDRTLLRPRPGSFYSVDALAPDVVRYQRRYLLYFSGNRVASAVHPRWTTGLAVSSNPMGPFRVDGGFRGRYLNGGTTVWRGLLWHLVEVGSGSAGELAVSDDGRAWRHVAWLPAFQMGRAKVVGADFDLSVEHNQLAAYMFLVHPHPLSSAHAFGRALYDGRRWHGFEPVLRRQASQSYEAFDVGEPDVFTIGGRRAMLYGGTAANMVRTIAVALARDGRWVRCPHNPIIQAGAPWAPTIAIDPSVLRAGRVTYVYYAGSRTRGLGSNLDGVVGVARYVRGR
jgi:hypothetical protein